VLADLHVHLYGCIRPIDLLRHVAACETVDWDWYETEFEAAYGYRPPARDLVEAYRAGDESVVPAFRDLVVFSAADSGSFARFQAKANLKWAATDYAPGRFERDVLRYAAGIRNDHVAQGVGHVELRCFPLAPLLEAFDRDSTPITQRVVASLSRRDPWRDWATVREAALGPHGGALVGVDWSGLEEGHPPRGLAEIFNEVRAFNDSHPHRALAILAHVGESFADKSLESAIRSKRCIPWCCRQSPARTPPSVMPYQSKGSTSQALRMASATSGVRTSETVATVRGRMCRRPACCSWARRPRTDG
jgi:hypothetical protein